jgi:hypothetical protein
MEHKCQELTKPILQCKTRDPTTGVKLAGFLALLLCGPSIRKYAGTVIISYNGENRMGLVPSLSPVWHESRRASILITVAPPGDRNTN